MSGRIHDLITAENFAKWAEGRMRVFDVSGDERITGNCAVAQWMRSSFGVTDPETGGLWWSLSYGSGANHKTPKWMRCVMNAYDNFERSGPALAQIARENA